jgi:hypothetical protein
MLNLKLGATALALELSSWSLMGMFLERSEAALLGYFLLHGAACVLLGLCMLPFLLGDRSRPRWAVVGLIAVFAFVIPVAGFFLVVVAILTIRTYPVRDRQSPFESMQLPEFDLHQHLQGGSRSIGMRALLNNPAVPAKTRFHALVSLNHISGHIASPLLRGALNDHSDDMRLLAYGMLDRMEQRISQSIHEASSVFKQAEHHAATHGMPLSPEGLVAARKLSDLYWELIYQGLAADDMREFSVQTALHYCELVLSHRPDEGPLHLRRGRLLHALGQAEKALACYDRALQLQIPETQVMPYQAEIHFERGDFPRVRTIMRQLKLHSTQPKLRPVIDYWS